MMDKQVNDKFSGRGLTDRLMDFMDAGDVWVQSANRRIGYNLLPEFSMIPALLAVLGLTISVAWCGVAACRALGEEVQDAKRNILVENQDSGQGAEAINPESGFPSAGFWKPRIPVPAMRPEQN